MTFNEAEPRMAFPVGSAQEGKAEPAPTLRVQELEASPARSRAGPALYLGAPISLAMIVGAILFALDHSPDQGRLLTSDPLPATVRAAAAGPSRPPPANEARPGRRRVRHAPFTRAARIEAAAAWSGWAPGGVSHEAPAPAAADPGPPPPPTLNPPPARAFEP
ncbi:MAG: hypothetical protein JO127_17150 [Caulobacteraceae bacterium]|nr:hypothetical protein [Caulobacteraceae bacterium]